MPDPSSPEHSASGAITGLLRLYAEGETGAFDRLVPLVYDDLRRIARLQLRRLRPGRAVDTTGLVHEAYLKMVDREGLPHDWNDRRHFFAVAASAMRQILIDHARYLTRQKRGGSEEDLPLDEARYELQRLGADAGQLVDLDDALRILSRSQPRQVRVVECRYFAGLSVAETAEALGVAPRTVHRDWLQAKAWLRGRLSGEGVP